MAKIGRYMKLSNSPLSEMEETLNEINKKKKNLKELG